MIRRRCPITSSAASSPSRKKNTSPPYPLLKRKQENGARPNDPASASQGLSHRASYRAAAVHQGPLSTPAAARRQRRSGRRSYSTRFRELFYQIDHLSNMMMKMHRTSQVN